MPSGVNPARTMAALYQRSPLGRRSVGRAAVERVESGGAAVRVCVEVERGRGGERRAAALEAAAADAERYTLDGREVLAALIVEGVEGVTLTHETRGRPRPAARARWLTSLRAECPPAYDPAKRDPVWVWRDAAGVELVEVQGVDDPPPWAVAAPSMRVLAAAA